MTEYYLASVFAQVPDAVSRHWYGPGPFFGPSAMSTWARVH